MGSLGENLGYRVAKAIDRGRSARRATQSCEGRGLSLVDHFGPGIRERARGERVLDFGCGDGRHCLEIARDFEAAEVVGLDIRDRFFEAARSAAAAHAPSTPCSFATETKGPFGLILSLDAFEHYGEPAAVLAQMEALLAPGGEIWISFGPPWYHPRGGHLFSIFPWAHLLFSEAALVRWRADFKQDGATRFSEVEGGLNCMTIARFERLLRQSALETLELRLVPIRLLRWLHARPTREFTTSLVQARLRAR